MTAPTPVDQDGINPNFLTALTDLQARMGSLERQAASGLFTGDTMLPPGPVTIQEGNLEVIGNRSIHRALFNLGPAIILIIDTGEVTVTQSYNKLAAESGATDTLDTINGGVDGDMVIFLADTGDTITISEAGNIEVGGATDTLLENTWFLAIYNGDIGKWVGWQAA